MSQISLIIGGARSGKSSFAEEFANKFSDKLYIATADANRSEINDDEMATRIKAHKERRDQSWRTIEEPEKICACLTREMAENRLILIDCLTLWLANIMAIGKTPAIETEQLLRAILNPSGHLIFISNEVGLSIVPENKLARDFRDEQGILNQTLAKRADNVVFMAAGLPMILKGKFDDH